MLPRFRYDITLKRAPPLCHAIRYDAIRRAALLLPPPLIFHFAGCRCPLIFMIRELAIITMIAVFDMLIAAIRVDIAAMPLMLMPLRATTR